MLAMLTIADKYNDSTRKYDQTVSLNGQVVSKLSTGSLEITPQNEKDPPTS